MKWSASADKNLKRGILILIGLALLFELIRDVQRDGDLVGYINAGNAVINSTPIYADYLNTWPPFFSIFSVPLAILDGISPQGIRLLWLLCIVLAWNVIIPLGNKLFLDNKTQPMLSRQGIILPEWSVLIPFLFVFRFVIDDISNIQINTFLLLGCLLTIKWYRHGQNAKAGILLGTLIALKVYPIFLLAFFGYRKAFKLVGYGLLTVGLTYVLSLMVFGVEQANEYYAHWLEHIAMGETIITHKNQSLLPLLTGILSPVSRGLDIQYNIMEITPDLAKRAYYVMVLVVGGLVAMKYWNSSLRSNSKSVTLFAFMLAAIPILSPLAWKYYFVFLYPIHVVLYQRVRAKSTHLFWRVVYFVALALTIISTDGLIGNYVSDVLEVFGVITISTLLFLTVFAKLVSGQIEKEVSN